MKNFLPVSLVFVLAVEVPNVAWSMDVATLQSSLSHAEARLAAKDAAGAKDELTSLSVQLDKDTANKDASRQVKFVASEVATGDVAGARDKLHSMITEMGAPAAAAAKASLLRGWGRREEYPRTRPVVYGGGYGYGGDYVYGGGYGGGYGYPYGGSYGYGGDYGYGYGYGYPSRWGGRSFTGWRR